jgi:hypothetical protein
MAVVYRIKYKFKKDLVLGENSKTKTNFKPKMVKYFIFENATKTIIIIKSKMKCRFSTIN